MTGMSFIKGQATERGPFHRLTEDQTKYWLLAGPLRAKLVSNLIKRYPSGVYVCSATLFVIGHVDSRGAVTEAPPPFRSVERWDLANKPQPKECHCADFTDPENSGKAWRERGSEEHHPLCQYDPQVFVTFQKASAPGAIEQLKKRPDTWIRLRKEARERGER